MNDIELTILKHSHLEHFKSAKEMAMLYPINHPTRLAIELELNILVEKINKISK